MAQPNPMTMLKTDHEQVRKLFNRLQSTKTGVEREALQAKIEKLVKVHAKIEEEIFYPAFQKAAEDKDQKIFHESEEEHRLVDEELAQLRQTDPESAQWEGRAKVLMDLVLHHAEEEEAEMFPLCQNLFDRDEMRDLAERLQERKTELMEEMGVSQTDIDVDLEKDEEKAPRLSRRKISPRKQSGSQRTSKRTKGVRRGVRNVSKKTAPSGRGPRNVPVKGRNTKA